MKSLKLFPFLFLLAACTGGTPKYDATGTFEATEVIVSAEASGKLLSFDIEEGTTLIDGQEVGIYRYRPTLSEETPVGGQCQVRGRPAA